MSVPINYTDFMNDIERYLRSRFPDRSEHVIQEIAAFISNRTIVLTNDIVRELESRAKLRTGR